jgi:hypothetical protein
VNPTSFSPSLAVIPSGVVSPVTHWATVGGWIDVRPPDEGYHTVPERASRGRGNTQPKCEPRPCERHQRGKEVTQVDGTTRARTRRNRRLGASPDPFAGGGDARCTEILRPSGRRIRHIPRGTHVSRTNRDTPRKRVDLPPSDGLESHAPVTVVRWPARPRAQMGETQPFTAGRMSIPRL